jgi:phage terminase large subunit-like protein
MREVAALPWQMDFLRDTTSRIKVAQGGYRSGKTVAAVMATWDLATRNPSHPILVVEPTYRMAMDVYVDTAERMLTSWGIAYDWKKSDKILHLHATDTKVYVRSADQPRSLEGITVAGLVADEWELFDPLALKVAMARVSVGPHQRYVFTGTPEGFGPGWALLLKAPRDDVRTWQIGTRENVTLTDSYVSTMEGYLDDAEKDEKLLGVRQQKNGRVYTRFDRRRHLVETKHVPYEGTLELWCDFNVGMMCWLLVEVSQDKRHAHVAREIIGYETDTQEHAERALDVIAQHIHDRTRRRVQRADVFVMKIKAPCDASARNRGALGSHASVLTGCGFRPQYASTGNPAVEDRVLSVQLTLARREGLTIDGFKCPRLVDALERQGRDASGAPSKARDPRQDLSGPLDALGYGVFWHWPALRWAANQGNDFRAQEHELARAKKADYAPSTSPMPSDVVT